MGFIGVFLFPFFLIMLGIAVGTIILVMFVGIIFLLAALVLNIIWIVKACKKKKTHILIKIFGILTAVLGFILFFGPILLGIVFRIFTTATL